jgi:hypothetical protein
MDALFAEAVVLKFTLSRPTPQVDLVRLIPEVELG